MPDTPPDPAQVQTFAAVVRRLGVVFLKTAAEQSAAHAAFSKQELLAIDVLGIRGACRMGEIAAHLGVGQSAITPLVDHLEAAGAVRRTRSKTDRRAWLVELTAVGAEAYASESVAYERVAAAMLAPLAPAERETLVALLARVSTSEPPPA